MNSRILSINRGVVDIRKVLWFIIIFEVLAISFALLGDMYANLYFWGVVFGSILLLFVLVEPVLIVPFMFITTGLHWYALITKHEYSEYNFSYFHIVIVLFFISVFINFLLRREKTIPSSSLWAPVIAFLTVIAFTLIYTPNFVDGLMEFSRLAALCVLALAIIICVNAKWKVEFVIWNYILITIGISLFSIYDILTGGEFYKSQVIKIATQLGIHVYRSTGTFKNPNDLATILMIGIIVAFGMLFVKKLNPFLKFLLVICISITSIALIATFSRGGWISTFVGVFVLIFLHRRWSYFGLFLGFLVLLLIVLSIKSPEIVLSAIDRFSTLLDPLGEESSSSRLSLIKEGIWMWQDHPILGVGSGSFSYYALDYRDPNMPQMLADVVLPHTLQSKILAEEGLIGITIATWFFFAVLFEGLRSIQSIKDSFLKNSQIVFTSLFIGFIVCFTFNSDMHHNIFWITVGMIYAVPLVYKKSLDDEKPQSGDTPLPLNDSSS